MPVVTSRFQHLRHGARALQNQLRLWMAAPLLIGGLVSVTVLSQLNATPSAESSSHSTPLSSKKAPTVPASKKAGKSTNDSTDTSPPLPITQQTEPNPLPTDQPSAQVPKQAAPANPTDTQPSAPANDTPQVNQPPSDDSGLIDELTDGLLP